MSALGIFNEVQFTTDHAGRGMKVNLELFVPNEHFIAWQELMGESPRMVRLSSLSELPVKLPKAKPESDRISGSNPEVGSW